MKVNTKEIIKELARQGKTFGQVAKEAGISVNTFGLIRKNGSGAPRSVYKIAKALGVEMEQIMIQED